MAKPVGSSLEARRSRTITISLLPDPTKRVDALRASAEVAEGSPAAPCSALATADTAALEAVGKAASLVLEADGAGAGAGAAPCTAVLVEGPT